MDRQHLATDYDRDTAISIGYKYLNGDEENGIKENPNISRNELANLTGISLKNIQKHINKLKELGLIRRIGSPRLGYWEIVS